MVEARWKQIEARKKEIAELEEQIQQKVATIWTAPEAHAPTTNSKAKAQPQQAVA